MADDNWYDENDDDGQGNPNLVNDLRKQLKEKAKAEKDLETKLNDLQAKWRATEVGTVLKSVGVSEKVAKLIPADVEPNAEAVGAWLEEYKDVFGIKQTEDSTSTDVDPNVINAMTAMNNVANSGVAPGGPSNVKIADIESAPDLASLEALILKAGGS